jgi:hypothetical protein
LRLGVSQLRLDPLIRGLKFLRTPISQDGIGGAAAVQERIAFRNQQLQVVGLRAQRVVASTGVRETRTSKQVALEFPLRAVRLSPCGENSRDQQNGRETPGHES